MVTRQVELGETTKNENGALNEIRHVSGALALVLSLIIILPVLGLIGLVWWRCGAAVPLRLDGGTAAPLTWRCGAIAASMWHCSAIDWRRSATNVAPWRQITAVV
ncbi:hypothetical protein TorRG33x02_218140 [Trema orientale]|uniref:Transmembrane protein n=1 Tax=Trema orientale TaxID=63057 RepID=A0A2P5EA91_TREOI|nr:hypothetical protein TorRG33x02_218140 [Trema orientale]